MCIQWKVVIVYSSELWIKCPLKWNFFSYVTSETSSALFPVLASASHCWRSQPKSLFLLVWTSHSGILPVLILRRQSNHRILYYSLCSYIKNICSSFLISSFLIISIIVHPLTDHKSFISGHASLNDKQHSGSPQTATNEADRNHTTWTRIITITLLRRQKQTKLPFHMSDCRQYS
jgi:hypothetical protein